jgi:hypothetical protein
MGQAEDSIPWGMRQTVSEKEMPNVTSRLTGGCGREPGNQGWEPVADWAMRSA